MTDLDLHLNNRFYKKLDSLKRRTNSYKSRVKRSKNFLKNATNLSKKDLQHKLQVLSKNPKPKDALVLMRNLLNSGVWISQSSIRYMQSLVDFTTSGDKDILSPSQSSILKRVQQQIEITEYDDEEIFKTIYNEVEYSHYYPDHKPLLNIPKIESTIVLVPGVFNEIFSTTAFQRAAQHLEDKTGNKYFAPKVNGFKSCEYNAKLIHKQLKQYTQKHPDEKLWLVCFSKGGLDSLHFLRNQSEFANEYIVGISTIASPILGSDHLNHRVIKLLNGLHNFSSSKVHKSLGSKGDRIAKEFQDSISSTFQRPWLRNNHEKLPHNLFYTALGFESNWYESHLWMMFAKGIFKSRLKNDGVVDAENSLFPYYFERGINLGIMRGHHLVGTRSSYFCQEALFESLIIFLSYKKLL